MASYRRLDRIERRDLVDLVEALHARDLAPSTIRNALDPVRVVFRRAVTRGDVQASPCAGLELPSGKAQPRTRVADGAETAALVEALTRLVDRALWFDRALRRPPRGRAPRVALA
jgi:integrase